MKIYFIRVKKIMVYLFALLNIFFLFLYIQPLKNKIIPLENNIYTLKTYYVTNNLAAYFTKKKSNVFYVHPGVSHVTKGVFTFLYETSLDFKFSIREGSLCGDVNIIVNKNNINIKKFNMKVHTQPKIKHVKVHVKRGDKIEIIIDKNGTTDYDWGKVEVEQTEILFRFENFLIPFLWFLFFIYLYHRGYIYLFIHTYFILLLYLYAEKLNFGLLEFETILIYSILLFTFSLFCILVYHLFDKLNQFKISLLINFLFSLIFYLLPLSFVIYTLNFHTPVSTSVFFDIFQSTSSEAYEFLFDFIEVQYIVIFFGVVIFLFFLLYQQSKKTIRKTEKPLIFFLIILFLTICTVNFTSLHILNFSWRGFHKYTKQIRHTKWIQEQRKTGAIKCNACKTNNSETYVVVFGESLNKRHMGLYHYFRDTTPLLNKMKQENNLLVFNNVFSSYNKTMHTLKYALTEKNQYNTMKYDDSFSIIEVLNKANIDTYWLTNQPLYGPMDNIVTVLAKQSKYFLHQNARDKYDNHLIGKLKKILKTKSDKNRVIFIHLYGNHVRYANRYPHDKYNKYTEKLDAGIYGDMASTNNMINSYDNSVLYNDYIVATILKELKKENGVNGFIYLSDHSEDVIGEEGKLFGHPAPHLFNFEMLQIPMLMWFNDEYKQRYLSTYKRLKKRENNLFTNDLLYDTMLGIFNVQTDKYHEKYDFTSDKYQLNASTALTMYGATRFKDVKNYQYWQHENISMLSQLNLNKKIMAYNINNIGKLQEIWRDGLHSFSVNVIYNAEKNICYLAHNQYPSKITLSKYLESVDISELEQAIVSVSNINKNNMNKIVQYLNDLTKQYHCRDKLFIKSNNIDFLNIFDGKKIYALNVNKNANQKIEYKNIVNTLEQKDIELISFSKNQYNAIKEYLEVNLSKNIQYIIENMLQFKDVQFKDKVKENKILQDDRVKAISVYYETKYK